MKLRKIAAATALAMATFSAKADITDGQFSINQIFDVQYYWSQAETPTTPDYSCYGTNTCEVLNASNFIAPYDQNFQHPTVTAGQYFKFFPSTTNPGTYGLGLYNANGSLAQVLHNTGDLTAIGPNAIFYVGSGFYGTVITTGAGYNYGDGASFTNMDTTVTSTDASSYTWASTTPLAAGQTASSGGSGSSGGGSSGPSYSNILTTTQITSVTPTSNNSPVGEGASNAVDGNPNTKYLNFDRANAGFTIKLDTPRVIRGITFTTANDFEPRDPSKYSLFGSNDGVNWTTIVDAESISLSSSRYTTTNQYNITNNDAYFYYFITFPSIKAIDTYGSIAGCQAALGSLACDSVQIGDVNFIYDTTYTSYTVPTDGGTGTIANPGTAGSNSSLAPPGPVAVTNNAGSTGTNTSGTTVLSVTNAGTYTNNGTTGNVTNTGDFTNNGTTGDVTNSGTFTNNGTVGAVDNSGTFTNNATGVTGNVTNSGTFNNAGTTGTVTNNLGGTFTNTGTVTTITNLGTFTNSGTGGAWTNGFNGDGNTATFSNTGTLGNGTNWSTFNNNTSGTVGTVSNFGTFNNTGTTGAFSNAGVLNNNAGGTIGELAYNNHWVVNNGTITTITYNGGTVNNAGTIGSINNTEAHGNFNNDGTVTGSVTTNSTFNNNATGVVQGLYTNTGTLNNAGTVGAVINDGTFDNTGTAGAVTLVSGTFTNTGTVASVDNTAGLTFTNGGTITGQLTNAGTVTNDGNIGSVVNTGTYTNTGTTGDWTNSSTMNNTGSMGNGTNSGTYSNTGTVGNVTNTGTMTTSGTAGLIANSGILTITAGSASVNNTGGLTVAGGTLNSYTQTSPGTTIMSLNQPIVVTGSATLGGGILINDVPSGYGRHTVLSASSVTGTYDPILSTSNYLKYSGSDVKLYVTPNATATQSSIDSMSKNISNAANLQSSAVTGALGNDCSVFGKDGACISVNIGGSKASTGDLYNGGLTIAKKINESWRFGVFTSSAINNPSIGSVTTTNDPVVGGFVTFVNDRFSVQASAATAKGTMTATRHGPETGIGKSNVDNQAYQIRANYSIPVTETVTVTPYAGIRYSESTYSGYTETGPAFPLTINSTSRKSTDALAGVSVAKQFTEKLTGSVSVGVTQKLSDQSATYTGTSEIGGLSTFSGALPSNGKTNASFGAGMSYSIDKTTRVGVSIGVQQKGNNANINSVGISLTKGF